MKSVAPTPSHSLYPPYLPWWQDDTTGHVPSQGEHDRHEVGHKRLVAATFLLAEDINLEKKRAPRVKLCLAGKAASAWDGLAQRCPLPGALTCASTFWWGWMDPGLAMTRPRLRSSRFKPRTRAPRLSPASALSRLLWNISMPRREEERQGRRV